MSLTPTKHGNWHVLDGVLVDVKRETESVVADTAAVAEEVAEQPEPLAESEPETPLPRSFLERFGVT